MPESDVSTEVRKVSLAFISAESSPIPNEIAVDLFIRDKKYGYNTIFFISIF